MALTGIVAENLHLIHRLEAERESDVGFWNLKVPPPVTGYLLISPQIVPPSRDQTLSLWEAILIKPPPQQIIWTKQWKIRINWQHIPNGFNKFYKIFYPNTKEYTFYLIVHGNFSKMDHILGGKTPFINSRRLKSILESYLTLKTDSKKISSKHTH